MIHLISSETKGAGSVMIMRMFWILHWKNQLIVSQIISTKELNSELMEGQREEKIERDTVLISAVKEDKEEVSSHSVLFVKRLSPASVQVPSEQH